MSVVTVSGNEITDASRAANVQGDGRRTLLYNPTTNIVPNGGFETNTTYWNAVGGGVLTQQSTYAKFGTYSGRVVCAHTFDGVAMTGMSTILASTQYTASVWIYHPTGGYVFFDATDNVDATVNNSASYNIPAGVWTQYSFTFTTDTHTSWVIRFYAGADAQTFYIDGLQVEAGSVVTPYIETASGPVTRPATYQGNDSSYGMYPGATNLVTNGGFETDTSGWATNGGGSAVARQTSVALFGNASAVVTATANFEGVFISVTGAAVQNQTYTGSVFIRAHAAGDVGKLVRMGSDGIGGTTESFATTITLTSAWQRVSLSMPFVLAGHTYQNFSLVSSGNQGTFQFDVDGVQVELGAVPTPYIHTDGSTATRAASRVTVGQEPAATNLIANGGFEVDTSGYVGADGTVTLSRSSAQAKFGTYSMAVATSAYNYMRTNGLSVTAGKAYIYSLWVYAPSGKTMALQSFRADFATALNTQVNFTGTGAWQYLTYQFIAQATETNYFFIYDTSGTAYTYYVDGVQLETDGQSAGVLTVSGNEITDIVRAAGVQGDGRHNDSSFGIWPAATNLVTNSGFETDLAGWIDQGTGVTRTRDTTTYKFGAASQKIVTNGASAYQGTGSPVCSWNIGDTLTASVWIYGVAGQRIRLVIYDGTTIIRGINGDNGDVLVNGWQRVVATGVAQATTTTGRVYIDTGGNFEAVTCYIDGVQLEKGAVAAPLLTVSGNEVTDAVRAAGVSGDGRTSDSSFGIWPASNPIWARDFGPGVESWQNDSSGSTITQSTDHALFRTHCLKMQWGGTNSYGVPNAFTPAAASTQYTATLWIQRTELTDTFNIYVQDNTYAAMAFFSTPAATLAPQKLTCTFTTAGGTTGLRPVIQVIGTSTAVFYVLADWCEPGPISTPFPGDGSTRAAARVQIPATYINPTQGWAAFRLRMGFASAARPAASLAFLGAFADGNNYLFGYMDTDNRITFVRKGGAGTDVYPNINGCVWGVGDTITVIFSWTAALIGLSFNGSGFTTREQTGIPTGVQTAELGTLNGSLQLYADILSACFGTGTLSDADAAMLNGLSRDPQLSDFSPTNAVTVIAPMDTVVYGNPSLPTAITTPYTPSSRAAARVQFPASYISAAQGWAAFRVRMGFPSAVVTNYPRLFTLSDGTLNNRLDCGTGSAAGHGYFWFDRVAGGIGSETNILNIDHAVAATMVVMPVWTPTAIAINVNNSAVVTTPNTFIPTGLRSQADLGSYDGTQAFLEGDILWACFGTGTAPDPAMLNGLSRDPVASDFTTANNATVIWTADSVVYGNPTLPVERPSAYIDTNGATVSRPAGSSPPAYALITEAQGWAAFRVRVGYPTGTGQLPADPRLFSWTDGTANNRIDLVYSTAGNYFALIKEGAGVYASTGSSNYLSFLTGSQHTIVVYWTSSTVGVSVDGTAFNVSANPQIPSGMQSSFDIGSFIGGSQAESDILWSCFGTGTAPDPTVLNALSRDPQVLDFVPVNKTRFIWTADTTAFVGAGGYDITTDASTAFSRSVSVTSDASTSFSYLSIATDASVVSGYSTISLTTDAVLTANISTSVGSDAVITTTVTSSVTSDASVTLTFSGVTTDSALSTQVVTNVTTDTALSMSVQSSVTSDSAIAQFPTSDVSSTSAVSQTTGSSVLTTAATAATATASVTSTASINAPTKDITTSAAVRGLHYVLTTGGEITDEVRGIGAYGDGLVNDSSFVIWPGQTNVVSNSGFETNTTGWSAVGAGTLSRSLAQSRFGAASGLITATSTYDGYAYYMNLSANTRYTVSGWFYSPAGASFYFDITDQVDLTFNNGTVNTIPAGVWTKLSFSGTLDAHTGWLMRIYSSSGAQTIYVDGLQVETGSLVSPYISSDGGYGVRVAPRPQLPASLLWAQQGWLALRVRTGWANTLAPSSFPTLFSWTDGTSLNRFALYYDVANGYWTFEADAANQVFATSINDTFAAGALRTLIVRWTPTTVGFSLSGAAYTSVPRAAIQTALSTLFDIAQAGGLLQFGGAVLWAAMGVGVAPDPTQSFLASSADPAIASFSTTCGTTAVWPALDVNYLSAPAPAPTMSKVGGRSRYQSKVGAR